MSKQHDFEDELRTELPRFYGFVKEFVELIKADAKQLAKLDDWMEDVVNQSFVETATWGLERWEEIFGIQKNNSKPIDQRRSVIKAKIRGAGVTTVALIKEVAESWYNGEIEVTEEALKVIIKFNSNFGVPSNLDDVEKALREIIPAHLLIEYLFKYLTVRDVNSMTIATLNNTSLGNFAGGA